ncbi:hypothetical protein E2562_035624 [Oryza meyeriana var. granulata]|uniref:Uncharacterized protein n=1 Tax=Oryza meyeriana var. granulata TaxID=110450 RepID=A0A6G1CB34_9ORYZ|nr:hypothetical protein E2562_035624 [Oryza meyeriana var. granulata]
MARSYRFDVAATAMAAVMVMLLLPVPGHAARLTIGIKRKGTNPVPFPQVPTEPFPPPPVSHSLLEELSSLPLPCRHPIPTEPFPPPPCRQQPPTGPPEQKTNTSPSPASIVV